VAGGAYNIASGTPHTVLDMARLLAGPGLPPRVTGQWRLGDVRHIVASPARAAAELGFTASVSFEQGMAEFAAAA
jgi:dTDP-L-rhamnose 4-epimerase